jgi:hypothetical protein
MTLVLGLFFFVFSLTCPYVGLGMLVSSKGKRNRRILGAILLALGTWLSFRFTYGYIQAVPLRIGEDKCVIGIVIAPLLLAGVAVAVAFMPPIRILRRIIGIGIALGLLGWFIYISVLTSMVGI